MNRFSLVVNDFEITNKTEESEKEQNGGKFAL